MSAEVTNASNSDSKKVKLNSADNEEFNVDREVVSFTRISMNNPDLLCLLLVNAKLNAALSWPCYDETKATRSVLIKNMLEGTYFSEMRTSKSLLPVTLLAQCKRMRETLSALKWISKTIATNNDTISSCYCRCR